MNLHAVIPALAILIILGSASPRGCGPATTRRSTNGPLAPSEKELAIAQIASGRGAPSEQSDIFSAEDIARLRTLRFRSSTLLDHLVYVDEILDGEKRQVRRTYFNFAGHPERVEVIVLDEESFWSRIRLLSEYHDVFGEMPEGLVDDELLRIRIRSRLSAEKKYPREQQASPWKSR